MSRMIVLNLAVVLATWQSVSAADIDPAKTSLGFVPATAATYSSSFQLRQQVLQLTRSNAVKKLMANPMVQQGVGQFQFVMEMALDSSPFGELLDQGEYKEILQLVGDAVSHEIFMYADEDSIAAVKALVRFSQVVNEANMENAAKGGGADEEEIGMRFVNALIEVLNPENVPGGVVGFKTTKKQELAKHLKHLEGMVSTMIENQPELEILKGRFKSEAVNDHEFMTLLLDEKMVPWEQIEGEIPDEIYKKLRKNTKGFEIKISLGLYKDYLLVAFGKDTDVIRSLGKGPSLLERKEMAPIKKAGTQPYIAIAYASEKMMQEVAASSGVVQQYARMGEAFVANFEDLDEELREEILKDLKTLRADVTKASEGSVGAHSQYSFFSDNGFEGYSYNWVNDSMFDGSKPLSILQHVGKDPMLVVAARAKHDLQAQQTARKWFDRGLYYLDIVMQKSIDDDDDLKEYQAVAKALAPLKKKLEQIIDEKLNPAFQDGQSAFVIDTKIRRKSWHLMQPPSEKALPMFEPAMIMGVSDRQKAFEGISELFELGDEAIGIFKENVPDASKIPFDTIPRPEKTDADGQTMYSYVLPPDAGVDSDTVLPNAILTDNFMFMSIMPETTKRLMGDQALDLPETLLGIDKPMYGVAHFNFEAFMQPVREWGGFFAEMNGVDIEMYNDFFEFAECFKGFSSVSYNADGAIVNHYEIRFEDLDE